LDAATAATAIVAPTLHLLPPGCHCEPHRRFPRRFDRYDAVQRMRARHRHCLCCRRPRSRRCGSSRTLYALLPLPYNVENGGIIGQPRFDLTSCLANSLKGTKRHHLDGAATDVSGRRRGLRHSESAAPHDDPSFSRMSLLASSGGRLSSSACDRYDSLQGVFGLRSRPVT